MEINHRLLDYSPSSTNPTAELMLSELSGGGGGGNGRKSVVQENRSGLVMEHLIEDLRPIKWTDEKHGLYLNSMEASFVHQLHDSINILGCRSQENRISQHYPSTQKHISNHNSSGQFKVFREGWSGKINFGRDEAELNDGDESGVDEITSNPWIRRYRSECRQPRRTTAFLREDLAMTDEFHASGFYMHHRVSSRAGSGPSLEVTDQNFIDEDTKGESECEIQSLKRIKTEEFSKED